MKHIRYAVKNENGFIRLEGKYFYDEVNFGEADLFLSKERAENLSSSFNAGRVVEVIVEVEEEMKKDKEWLKDEVARIYDTRDYWSVDDLKDEILDSINELDEPEVLSQEWIDEHKVSRINNFKKMTMSDVVPVDKLKDLLVPKQEKVVVPKFVADWMGENSTGKYAWWKKIAEWEGEVPDKDRKVYDWYAQCNEDTFIIAWITSHYEIEEESLFYVYLGDGHYLVSEDELREPYAKIRHLEYSGFMNHVTRFTEQEIKDYDERFWAFAAPVEDEKDER